MDSIVYLVSISYYVPKFLQTQELEKNKHLLLLTSLRIS